MIWLVDTHVLLWWLTADVRLSELARRVIGDSRESILWSSASSHEIAVKVSVGKLSFERPLSEFYRAIQSECGARLLSIGSGHCLALAELPLHHRDPFDRMLVAQAMVEGIPLLSADDTLRAYDADVRW